MAALDRAGVARPGHGVVEPRLRAVRARPRRGDLQAARRAARRRGAHRARSPDHRARGDALLPGLLAVRAPLVRTARRAGDPRAHRRPAARARLSREAGARRARARFEARAAVSPDLAQSFWRCGRRLSITWRPSPARTRAACACRSRPPAAWRRWRACAGSRRAWPSTRARAICPALDGTSRLSIYFKNGSLTPAQAIAALEIGDATFAEGSSRSAFLREIVWREFYYHVLWHRPDVETQAFLPQFRKLRWQNREDWFEAWKAGRTGYPIVDAGMRQLAETGWMHNRVRMMVRVVPDQGPAHRLALGRALLHGPAARRRSRAQQRRLAVGGVDRVRSAARISASSIRRCRARSSIPTGRTCARICPSGATTIGRRFT